VTPRITIFTPSYPPAFLAGGPARSLYALVEALVPEFRFSIVTSATDGSAKGQMLSVEPGRWSSLGHADVWYEPRRRMSARMTARRLTESKPNVVYLNSLFDYRFGILPLLVARTLLHGVPIVLAPRGELSAGALALKRRKKRVFNAIFRTLRLHHVVAWHASTDQEKADIERVFGLGVKVHVAIDLRTGLSGGGIAQTQREEGSDDPQGRSLVFLSRIVPKKNLATLIQAMRIVQGDPRLAIAGPIEDARYWNQCLRLIHDLPEPGRVKYVGTVAADEVVSFFNRFDLFVFPTLGENFGHVVLESLAAGTPVIVGEDTPWRHVEASGAGWVCDPTDPKAIAERIECFLSLGEVARGRMRMAARDLAEKVLTDPSGVDANRLMFRAAVSREPM
jgi:glycosyltransferase involved in cell wall biosynthesis